MFQSTFTHTFWAAKCGLSLSDGDVRCSRWGRCAAVATAKEHNQLLVLLLKSVAVNNVKNCVGSSGLHAECVCGRRRWEAREGPKPWKWSDLMTKIKLLMVWFSPLTRKNGSSAVELPSPFIRAVGRQTRATNRDNWIPLAGRLSHHSSTQLITNLHAGLQLRQRINLTRSVF